MLWTQSNIVEHFLCTLFLLASDFTKTDLLEFYREKCEDSLYLVNFMSGFLTDFSHISAITREEMLHNIS